MCKKTRLSSLLSDTPVLFLLDASMDHFFYSQNDTEEKLAGYKLTELIRLIT